MTVSLNPLGIPSTTQSYYTGYHFPLTDQIPVPRSTSPPFVPAGPLSRSKKGIFISQVFSTISLSKAHNACRVQSSGLSSTPGRDTESERDIISGADYDTLMLRAILRGAGNMRLDDMRAVEKRHNTVRADPNLMSRMLGKNWQSRDMNAELI